MCSRANGKGGRKVRRVWRTKVRGRHEQESWMKVDICVLIAVWVEGNERLR